MGRRVVFGVDLKPYIRRYLLVKLRRASVWETQFGFELLDGIERVAGVKYLQLHPDERLDDAGKTLRFRAYLLQPRKLNWGSTADAFWLSVEREKTISGHVARVFQSELYLHVGPEGERHMRKKLEQFMAQYSIGQEELDESALRMIYYRTRDNVRAGRVPALLRRPSEG